MMKNFTSLLSPSLAVALGSIAISFSSVFVNITTTPPTTDGVYRMLFGGVVLLSLMLIKKEAVYIGARACLLTILAAFFFALDLAMWHQSIHYLGPGLATILVSLQVFVLAIVGVTYFRENISWKLIVALPVTIVGLYLLVWMDWQNYQAQYQLGIWLGLFAMLCYSAMLLVLRYSQKTEQRLPLLSFMAQFTLYTGIFLAIFTLLQGQSFSLINTENTLWLILYGVFCQAFGWLLITYGLPKIKLSIAGFMLLLQPALSFVWDMLFFSRPTTVIEIVGAALTLLAIYLVATNKV